MRQLKPFISLFVMIALLASCAKNPVAPALGDHTVDLNNGQGGGSQVANGTKVLSLGSNWGDIFQTGPKGRLYVRNSNQVFVIYSPDDTGVFGTGKPFPGDPWGASASYYYMGSAQNVQTVMIANVPPAGLFRFDVDAQGFLSIHPTTNPADPWPTNFGFWYGDGWDNFDVIAHRGKFVFQISHNQGEALLRSDFQEFTDDWSTWNRPGTLRRDDTGLRFPGYISVMSMGINLLVVTQSGDLMDYIVGEDGSLANGIKIGQGWNIYKKIAATGNDILGVTAGGDVFRYTINLDKTDNDAKP